MPDTTAIPPQKHGTRAGNYFISNYPPFSFWTEDQIAAARREEFLDRRVRPLRRAATAQV